jgi:hypothetical protein
MNARDARNRNVALLVYCGQPGNAITHWPLTQLVFGQLAPPSGQIVQGSPDTGHWLSIVHCAEQIGVPAVADLHCPSGPQ